MKYDMYHDPGHAWVKVKKSELGRLGIADQITGCSYMRGDHAYLEEDCDATLFFKTKQEQGEAIALREHGTNQLSRIRNYNCYRVTEAIKSDKTIEEEEKEALALAQTEAGKWILFAVQDIKRGNETLWTNKLKGTYPLVYQQLTEELN